MDGAIPELVILGSIESRLAKPWEQVSKQHPSMATASAPASRFFTLFEPLSWLPLVMNSNMEV